MCCPKEPICAGHLGHLKPRMFMVSVLEVGGKPETDPHLFTRWSLPCSSLVSPTLFPSPSVCLFPSLSVLPLSGGLCAANKDVQYVSPSCASGAVNCLITAATPLPEHPSSVKQNFLSVWSPRLHFHICIFLLLLSFFPSSSPFSPFWATGAVAHIMHLSLAEAGREMEPQRLAFCGLVPRERQIAHLIIHDTDGNTIGRGREMRGEIKRGEQRKEGGGENARVRRLEFQIYQRLFATPFWRFFFSFILIQKVSISSSFPPFFLSAFCSIFLNQDGCRLMGTLYYSTFITEGQPHSFSFENQMPHIYAAQIIVCHFPRSDGKMDRRLSWEYLHKKPLCYRGTRRICFACAFI